jgi:hypothetical protein
MRVENHLSKMVQPLLLVFLLAAYTGLTQQLAKQTSSVSVKSGDSQPLPCQENRGYIKQGIGQGE